MAVIATKQCTSCGHGQAELRKITCSNGVLQIKWQCLGCGKAIGGSIRHADAPPLDKLLDWDVYAAPKYWQEQKQEVRALWAARRERYKHYLQSSAWWSKRERVMTRAEGLCEGCRCEEASEVHHLTYAHIYSEFLFELVALCRDCHSRWHESAEEYASAPEAMASGQ